MRPDRPLPASDVLEWGDPAAPPRWVRPTWASRRLLVAVVLLALGAAGADRLLERQEREAVAGCVAQAERAIDSADAELAQMADYLAPALYLVETAPRRAGLHLLMADAAAEALPAVEAARDRCSAARVLPTHRALRERRAAYVDYLDARAAHLAAISADGGRYYRDTPELTALRERLAEG